MTITCGIQSNGVVTMAVEMLHNSCNMSTCLICMPKAWGPWAYISYVARGLRAYISGKYLMPMLQLLHNSCKCWKILRQYQTTSIGF